MLRILLTLIVASVALMGCKKENGPKSITYLTVKLSCDLGGETRAFVFADNKTVYHNVYIGDAKINVEIRRRETKNIIEDHYWLGSCHAVKTKKEVVIEPSTNEYIR